VTGALPPQQPYHVERATEVDDDALLAVLADTYGHPYSQEWLDWKHRRGPWGPSRVWVAVDDDGLVGVAFTLPWAYRVGASTVAGTRLVDGGTAPRALRRGVFRAVVRAMLDDLDARPDAGISVATATPEAQGSHVKNGARALEPTSYAYGIVRWRGAALDTGDGVLDGYRARATGIATAWDGSSLRWRTDERIGHRYEVAGLVSADEPAGVVYRIAAAKGMRVVVPCAQWGRDRDQLILLGAVARRAGAVGVLAPYGPGAAPQPWRPLVRRGATLLCVWTWNDTALDPFDRSSWAIEAADVEGVI
jgi:hypothetical protein